MSRTRWWPSGCCRGASLPRSESLSRARTLHGLTLHSATLAHRGAAGFDDLVRLAEAVPGVQVALGSADEVLDLLAPLVGAG